MHTSCSGTKIELSRHVGGENGLSPAWNTVGCTSSTGTLTLHQQQLYRLSTSAEPSSAGKSFRWSFSPENTWEWSVSVSSSSYDWHTIHATSCLRRHRRCDSSTHRCWHSCFTIGTVNLSTSLWVGSNCKYSAASCALLISIIAKLFGN